MPQEHYLVLDHLVKRFDDFVAVDGVTLEVHEGEFIALLGPSGCGKTTTLRMLAGFWNCDGGEIRVGGERIEHLPPQARPTAMVFQDYALFPHLTVFQNVAFGLRMQKRPKTEIADRVAEVLDMVHLPDIGTLYPGELSGGMKQRVALARSIVLKPDILLLDEPLSNLDAKLRNEMRLEIRRLHNEAGTTSVFVTHDLHEAFFLGDRVAVMNRGKIEQLGTPQDIYYNPNSRFVADFVGHANIFQASVTGISAGRTIMTLGDGSRITGPDSTAIPTAADVLVGDKLEIAIPSHCISLFDVPGSDAENQLQGRVLGSGYLGAAIQVQVAVDGVGEFLIDMPSEDNQVIPATEQEVLLSWATSDLIVLPPLEDRLSSA